MTNLVSVPNETAEPKASTRDTVQERLSLADQIAADPKTVFCVQTFDTVAQDNGERLSSLLARVMAAPDRSLIVATPAAFVFAFGRRPHVETGPEA